MTKLNFRIGVVAVIAFAWSGCASLFRSSPPSVELIGPDSLSASNAHGKMLRVYYEDGHARIVPQQGEDDSIILSRRGMSHGIALAKRASPWILLDLLSEGPGFLIDDASHWWYNYEAIYVRPDSTGGDWELTSSNWLGEPSGRKRPELLLTGGLGVSASFRPTFSGEAGALLGPANYFPSIDIRFEGGVGVDLYKKFEIFYLSFDDAGYALTNDAFPFAQTADIIASNIATRYFFHNNFFAQLSGGLGYATYDTISAVGNDSGNFVSTVSRSFPVLGIGLGWAGDISYVELGFLTGLRSFTVGKYGPLNYQLISLNFGLNFRF